MLLLSDLPVKDVGRRHRKEAEIEAGSGGTTIWPRRKEQEIPPLPQNKEGSFARPSQSRLNKAARCLFVFGSGDSEFATTEIKGRGQGGRQGSKAQQQTFRRVITMREGDRARTGKETWSILPNGRMGIETNWRMEYGCGSKRAERETRVRPNILRKRKGVGRESGAAIKLTSSSGLRCLIPRHGVLRGNKPIDQSAAKSTKKAILPAMHSRSLPW